MNNNRVSGQILSEGVVEMTFSIDTLRLHVRDFAIDAGAPIIIQPNDHFMGEGGDDRVLFRDRLGGVHRGKRAYLNTGIYQLTIKPVGRQDRETGEVEGRHGGGIRCFVQASLPKVARGENYYPVDERGARDAVKALEKQLQADGVFCTLEAESVSRIDFFRNVQTEHDTNSYYQVMEKISPSLQRGRKRDYGTGWLIHNTQQEFCVYDKLVEMTDRGVDIGGYPLNTLRFEHRLLNGAKTQAVLGAKRLRDVLERYDRYQQVERDAWRKMVFCYHPDFARHVILPAELKKRYEYYRDRYGARWVDRMFWGNGAKRDLQDAGFDVVLETLAGMVSERTFSRLRGKLRGYRDELAFGGGTVELSSLYQELQEKVCLN